MGSESDNNKAHTSIKKDDMINNKWGLVAGRGCSPCIFRQGSKPPLYILRRKNLINNMTCGSRAGTPLLPNPRSCSPRQEPATAEGRHTAWCPYLQSILFHRLYGGKTPFNRKLCPKICKKIFETCRRCNFSRRIRFAVDHS